LRVTVKIAVKGVRYYDGAKLTASGKLKVAASIRLEHQKNNPHDSNAVAIKLKSSGAMLGHISRELAPKYALLIGQGKIVQTVVSKIQNSGERIEVSITYEQEDSEIAQKHNSRFWKSICKIQKISGVYSIECSVTGRQYVGSSVDVASRTKDHFAELCSGRHSNGAFQSDFQRYGWDVFEATVIRSGLPQSALSAAESSTIDQLFSDGVDLYNMTQDGQGIGFKPSDNSNTETISDRRASKLAKNSFVIQPAAPPKSGCLVSMVFLVLTVIGSGVSLVHFFVVGA
jgi:hypothetical protein